MLQRSLLGAWRAYEPKIRALGLHAITPTKIHPSLILYTDDRYTVVFAPFLRPKVVEKQAKTAKVFFVGLTPGRDQAIAAVREYLQPDASKNNNVSFVGSMRTNMVKMLDRAGLARCLNIESTADVFAAHASHLACSTSLLRFPVFRSHDKSNFSGPPNSIRKHVFLNRMVEEIFYSVFTTIDHPCLVIPMGKTVAQFCEDLCTKNSNLYVLKGFPHPSGSNGHRKKIFDSNFFYLEDQIKRFKRRLRIFA